MIQIDPIHCYIGCLMISCRMIAEMHVFVAVVVVLINCCYSVILSSFVIDQDRTVKYPTKLETLTLAKDITGHVVE